MSIPRWAWVVGGVIALFVIGMIALAGAGVYFVTKQVQVQPASLAGAETLFDESRARFKDAKPLIELDVDGDLLKSNFAGAKTRPAATQPLDALHILAWEPNDEKVVQVAIPFWLLRLKRGPLEVFSETAGLRRADLRITVEDLEALGPSLLIDHRGRDGERVLVWTQ